MNTLAEARRYLVWARSDAGRELRLARHNAGLTLAQAGRRLGWSKTKLSRGIRPSVRFFPTGRRIADAGQIELLATLIARMHPRWQHRHEVPMPRAGDLRAADLVSSVEGCQLMVEAYRRFADAQAQVRAARLKQRDLGADRLLLLIEDTRANRAAVASALPELKPSFTLTARMMLGALTAGIDPGGDAVVLLRRRPASPLPVAPHATKGERAPAPSPGVAHHATSGE